MRNDNIEVFARRVGARPTRFLEYIRPGHAQKFQSKNMVSYIEATSEERFHIHVRLHHGFRYFTATCLEVRLWLDAHEEPDVYVRKKVQIPSGGLKYFNFVLKDFAVQVGHHWENGELCFGDVQIEDEESENPHRRSDLNDRAKKLGCIRVSVQRGRQDSDAIAHEEPESVDLQGKITLDNRLNGITHYVKTVNNRVIAPPASDTSTRFKRTAGPHGERYTFEFRYRHRSELQRLGMIDDDGRPISLDADKGDDLLTQPIRRMIASAGPSQHPAPLPASSPPTISAGLPPHPPSLPGLSSSPLSGQSSKRALPGPGTSSLHGPSSQPALPSSSGPSIPPGPATSPKPHKKRRRLLAPPTSSSPGNARASPIDLTRSVSPAAPSPTGAAPGTTAETRTGTGTGLLSPPPPPAPPPTPSSNSDAFAAFRASLDEFLENGSGRRSAGPAAATTNRSSLSLPFRSSDNGEDDEDDILFLGNSNSSSSGGGGGGGTDEPMSEAELELELRRMRVQQRAFEVERRQLAMRERQMEFEIRLARVRRARGAAAGGGSAAVASGEEGLGQREQLRERGREREVRQGEQRRELLRLRGGDEGGSGGGVGGVDDDDGDGLDEDDGEWV